MTYPRQPLLALLVLSLSACASSGAQQSTAAPAGAAEMPATSEPAATGASDAVMASAGGSTFSETQADRGRDIFRAACTECHYSSEFSDSQFKFKWSRRSAGGLYQLIQTSMPETAPGSLTPEESVDIVSYIMRMNGFEPGSGELSSDRAVLDAISFASIRNQ